MAAYFTCCFVGVALIVWCLVDVCFVCFAACCLIPCIYCFGVPWCTCLFGIVFIVLIVWFA